MKVSELIFKNDPLGFGGTVTSHNFPNGYGASIIAGTEGYTSEDAPYELAVLHNNEVTYDTPLTGGVLGYLIEDEVNEYLLKIEAL